MTQTLIDNNIGTVISILTGGGLATILTFLLKHKKTTLDAEQVRRDSDTSYILSLQAKVIDYNNIVLAQNATMQEEINRLMDHVQILNAKILELSSKNDLLNVELAELRVKYLQVVGDDS